MQRSSEPGCVQNLLVWSCRERSALQSMAMQHLDGAETHEIQLVQDTADGTPLWDQNREGAARVPQST